MQRTSFTVSDLRQAIDQLPRVHLGVLPTPLEESARLSDALGGPPILFKRDDLTGLAFGGNKTRHLEFILGEALQRGADTIITGASIQSNFCRQTAAACAKLGLRCILYLNGEEPNAPQGNLLLDHLVGADVRLVQVRQLPDLIALCEQAAVEERQAGRDPIVVDLWRGIASLGSVSYVDCALELKEQLEELGLLRVSIYLSSATATQGGLVLAAQALGLDWQIVGISPIRTDLVPADVVANLANEAAQRLNLELHVSAADIENQEQYIGPGYALPTEDSREALEIVASTEGIILDPVYTAKAMAGLIDHIRAGELDPSRPVVFLHTGGTPALFAFNDWYVSSQ
jgi:D-cysteine desulfhydrase family pyridoxal phosphate-dependent enzyme